MSETAWLALADRFQALADGPDLRLFIQPAALPAGPIPESVLGCPFDGPMTAPTSWAYLRADGGGRPGERHVAANRLRWLSWAAGVLIRPDAKCWHDRQWWLAVRHQHPADRRQYGAAELGDLAARSADVARRLAAGQPAPPSPDPPSDQEDHWPHIRSSLMAVRDQFAGSRWADARVELELTAYPDLASYPHRLWASVGPPPPHPVDLTEGWELVNGHRGLAEGETECGFTWYWRQIGEPHPGHPGSSGEWLEASSVRTLVRGERPAAEAFRRLVESAAALLPLELWLMNALFAGWSRFQNMASPVEEWYQFMYVMLPSGFDTVEADVPTPGCRRTRVRGSPFLAAASAIAAASGPDLRAVVRRHHDLVVRFNPWLTRVDQAACLLAVEAGGAVGQTPPPGTVKTARDAVTEPEEEPPPADGPCDPYSFTWAGVTKSLPKSKRRLYPVLTQLWTKFRSLGHVELVRLTKDIGVSSAGRTIGEPTVEQYVYDLRTWLLNEFPSISAVPVKDGDFIRWVPPNQVLQRKSQK